MIWQVGDGEIDAGVGGGGGDFSSILEGFDISTAVVALIAVAALIAVLGFASWAAKKIAKFFDDAAPLARGHDPHYNKGLYLRMREIERQGGNLGNYSEAQRASYRREKKA